MSKINFPKKQEQRLIPKYLLEYAEELQENHPDPSEDWGGSAPTYTAGEGIVIDNNEISVDEESVAMVANLDPVAFSGNYNDLSNKPSIPTKTSDLTNDSGFITSSALSGLATETYVDDAVDDLDETLAQVAKTGSYLSLSDKPDLTIYELKTDAFTGDYNDLTNKPTIPTKTSDLTNDSGFITNSALSDYERKLTIIDLSTSATSGNLDATTLAGITANPEAYAFRRGDDDLILKLSTVKSNTLYYTNIFKSAGTGRIFGRLVSVFLGNGFWQYGTDYTVNMVTGTDDGTNWTSLTIGALTRSIPSGGSNYTAGTGIDITNNTISIDNTVALKSELFSGNYNDLTNKPDLTVYELKTDAFSGSYNDLTDKPTLFSGNYNDLTNKPDLSVYAESADLATVATTGDYDDLTNKPTIPTVNDPTITFTQGGVTKGTITLNQSSNQTIALDSGSAPTNMVTTDTAQTITGTKTFTTNPIDVVNAQKGIKLHSGANNSTNAKLGFTLFNSIAGSSNNEVGFLESNTASATNNGHSTLLGYYNTSRDTAYSDWELGFAYRGYNTTKRTDTAYKLVIPNQYNLNNYNTKRYIPIDFTDGTNTVRSDATGIVNISSLMPTVPTNYVTTDTTQTISGNKTFSDSVVFNEDVELNGTSNYINKANIAEMSISPDCLFFDSLTITNYDNLEDVIIALDDAIAAIPTPTVLYDVPNGENGVNPITMSDSFANYDYVDIQYRNYDNANQVKSVRIYNPNGKEVYVDWSVLNNGYIYAKKSIYTLSGNTMTVKAGSDMQAYYSNGSNMGVQVSAEAQYQLQIKITKVVGWKDSRLS